MHHRIEGEILTEFIDVRPCRNEKLGDRIQQDIRATPSHLTYASCKGHSGGIYAFRA